MTDIVFTVPEAPSAVKALVMSGDSILVSWKPPEQPNGIVSQYTVYVREDSEEAKDVSVISDLTVSIPLCYMNISHIFINQSNTTYKNYQLQKKATCFG
jgi:hypothetical protein